MVRWGWKIPYGLALLLLKRFLLSLDEAPNHVEIQQTMKSSPTHLWRAADSSSRRKDLLHEAWSYMALYRKYAERFEWISLGLCWWSFFSKSLIFEKLSRYLIPFDVVLYVVLPSAELTLRSLISWRKERYSFSWAKLKFALYIIWVLRVPSRAILRIWAIILRRSLLLCNNIKPL